MNRTERFWKKVAKGADNECWNWQAGRTKAGYGVFRMDKKVVFAHRVAYELACSTIPSGMHVLHSCDNPACVNPSHLRVGTHAENMLDKVLRNRQSRVWSGKVGEAVGMGKLRDRDLPDIRKMIAQGMRQVDIANKYGVHQAMISNIKLGKNWSAIQ
jgi:hypothetical protein